MSSLTDKITDVRNGARPNSAKVSTSRASGVTTLACDNLTGWPTASAVHFVTYQVDTNNDPVSGTQADWKGLVTGNSIGSLTLKDGTDNGNTIGDIVEMLPTAAWGQDLADGLATSHNRDGTHKSSLSFTTPTLTSPNITTPVITSGGSWAGSPTITTPTLTTPAISSFASATHTHANSANGGQISTGGLSLPTTTGSNGGSAGGSTNYCIIGGVTICWGRTASFSASSGASSSSGVITFPVTFGSAPSITVSPSANIGEADLQFYVTTTPTTTSATLIMFNGTGAGGGSGTATAEWIAIGKT